MPQIVLELRPVQVRSLDRPSLGASVGWKRFALAGGVAKVSSPDPALGDRKSAVVGVSYNLKKFTGRVALGSERSDGRIAALAAPDNVSVDVGAAYNLSRRIAVTQGSVRS